MISGPGAGHTDRRVDMPAPQFRYFFVAVLSASSFSAFALALEAICPIIGPPTIIIMPRTSTIINDISKTSPPLSEFSDSEGYALVLASVEIMRNGLFNGFSVIKEGFPGEGAGGCIP